MSQYPSESPFQDLPGALVEEMLSRYKELGEKLTKSFEEVQTHRERIKQSLSDQNLLKDDAQVVGSRLHPTCCGVDGSYAIERLSTLGSSIENE